MAAWHERVIRQVRDLFGVQVRRMLISRKSSVTSCRWSRLGAEVGCIAPQGDPRPPPDRVGPFVSAMRGTCTWECLTAWRPNLRGTRQLESWKVYDDHGNVDEPFG